MRIDIITVVPELLKSPFSASIVKRAIDKGLVEIHVHDLRSYGLGRHRQVDDYLYGGGAGMVMRIEPIDRCLAQLQAERDYDEVIFMAPGGKPFIQADANALSLKKNLTVLCGHYKGVDQRVRDHLITREISIGDYVLSGGELAAAVVADAVIRLIPGVLGNASSALTDSFQDGLLAPPVYTRPAEYKEWKVPEVLLSGNFRQIEDWRDQQVAQCSDARGSDLSGLVLYEEGKN
ncbi:MAG: tRNA (guanosine(37)-N1)-methyltransferase TrmD [Flavobacteriales bacterium AspAUS03]